MGQILSIAGLIVIGVLLFELVIFIHEFGHFITAKKSGIKVNEFSLGMGPRICGFKKGETAYNLRAFPIGGFCAMEGEDEDSDNPRAFNNAKIWKRMIVIIAGAVMNILLGFVLMFFFVVQMDSYSSTTVAAFQPDSVTASCGLQKGDKIVDIGGFSVANSRDLSFAIATLKCDELDGKSLYIYRQDCTGSLKTVFAELYNEYKPDEEKYLKAFDILDEYCTKIFTAQTKQDAKSLMESGSKALYDFYGKEDYTLPQINEREKRLRYHGDVTVVRDGKEVKLEDMQFFTYYASQEDKDNGKTSIAFDFSVEGIEKNIGSVLSETFTETISVGKMVWTSLVWIVQGRFSFSDLSGPVGIVQAASYAASQGLETGFMDAVNNLLFLMILITVNLGMFNMLPFPALDGGRFVLLLIEGIFRKPVPRKVEKYINAVGLILLMGFALVISVKDIFQWITGTGPLG